MTVIPDNRLHPATDHAESATIDKSSYLPAYAQLSQKIRRQIADKTYPPGSRLPAESSLGKQFGVSTMTVRQALSVLVEDGLVERIQGSGTFVRRVQVAESFFTFEGLNKILSRSEKMEVKILKAKVEKAGKEALQPLGLTLKDSVIVVERLLFHEGKPMLFQVAITKFAPESPIVETLLESDVLTGLISNVSHSNFKKGELNLLPEILGSHEAELLNETPGTAVFKLEHLFYDFNDQPAAFGWFIISPDRIPMTSRIGVWNE